MIRRLEPSVRKLLVACRCLAKRGDADGAIRLIDETVAGGVDGLNRVALLMLKAEILYLNCQEEAALNIFRSDIDPLLASLPPDLSTVIGKNRNDVARQVFDAHSDREFYQLYDQERLLGYKSWDAQSMIYALDAVEENRHYDALPAFWLGLVEGYRQGGWGHYRHASEFMAKECLRLGWLTAAAHHAVTALDEKLVGEVGKHLLFRRDVNLIRDTVRTLVDNANLRHHAQVACVLIEHLADAVPDDQIEPLLLWLLRFSSIEPVTLSESRLVTSSWDALEALTPRLNAEQAGSVVQAATAHSLWGRPNVLREHIVSAVNGCVAALPAEDLATLANQSIPVATTHRSDIDYGPAINLLCHIAQRGDDRIKSLIGNALYPTEVVENAILMQVAQIFGRQLAESSAADDMARGAAADVRRQVVRQRAGENEAEVAGGYGRVTARGNGEAISVSIYSFTGLEAVINHRALITLAALQELLDAILAMIREPENIPANKVGLISIVAKLADRLTTEMADAVFETLGPIAAGAAQPASVITAGGDPDNPLNPFKMNLGKPEQVRAAALYTLAQVENHLPGMSGGRFDTILEQALTDIDADIRRAAFSAAGQIPAASPQVMTGLLLGTRDADITAAEAAYVALAKKREGQFTDGLWHQLVYSLNLAASSPNASIRRAAAFTISNLRNRIPNEEVRAKVRTLEASLILDICYSVRDVLASTPTTQARTAAT